MKPMKIIRYNGSYRYKQQRRKRILSFTLAFAIALAVLGAAAFAVWRISLSVTPAAQPVAQPEPETVAKNVMSSEETVKLTLVQGELCMLTVPPEVDIREVEFTSGNEDVIRVDSAGRVDAVGEGKAKVTATAVGFEASCGFTVTKAEEAQTPSERTTAYTANEDILAQNREKGKDDLYNITVNRRTNTVTVYTYNAYGGYDVPVRAMVCSCGEGGPNVTPTGDFAVYFHESWHPLYGDVYGMYVSGISGPYLFHSVPYNTMKHNDLETEEFNKLGTNVSQGCVRLMAADARWIMKNCPLNTPVRIIDADSSADPLGTPPAVRLDSKVKWDPTDPYKKNPFSDKLPEITGVKDKKLKYGREFDPLKGVSAADICGNDITGRVTVSGEVLTDKPGEYRLTYSVTDDFHLTAAVDITVTVKEPEE